MAQMRTIWAIFRFVAVLAALLFPHLASAGVPAPKAETCVKAIDVVVESGLKATSLCEAETRSAEAERAREVASRCSIGSRGGAGAGRRGGLTPHPGDRVDLPGGHRGRYQAAAGHEGIERLPKDYDVHHSIPQELRGDPRIAGIDIDSPVHTRGIRGSRSKPAGPTRNVHQHITNEWGDFLSKNPNATTREILEFRDLIDERFGFAYWENQQRVIKGLK